MGGFLLFNSNHYEQNIIKSLAIFKRKKTKDFRKN